jgi:hypothetical protein
MVDAIDVSFGILMVTILSLEWFIAYIIAGMIGVYVQIIVFALILTIIKLTGKHKKRVSKRNRW